MEGAPDSSGSLGDDLILCENLIVCEGTFYYLSYEI